jgi:hypothetical protein
MKSNFYLTFKAWQLNLISIFLLFGSIFLMQVGIFAFKVGLSAWFLFNLLYLITISHFIEERIAFNHRPSKSFFSFAVFFQFILFFLLTFLCLGPDRIVKNDFYVVLIGLPIGLLGLYCYYYAIKILLIVEKKKGVDFSDVLGEYFKIGFTFLNIYSIQKRAIHLIGYDNNRS